MSSIGKYLAAVCMQRGLDYDRWALTSDKTMIVDASDPIFVDNMDALVEELRKRYLGRIITGYGDQVHAYKTPAVSSDNLTHEQLALSCRAKAIELGAIEVGRHDFWNLRKKGLLTIVEDNNNSNFTLIKSGFIYDGSVQIMSYDPARYSRILKAKARGRKLRESNLKKKGVQGSLKVTQELTSKMCDFRYYLAWRLNAEVGHFRLFKFVGIRGPSSASKVGREVVTLLKLCQTFKVNYKEKSTFGRWYPAGSDYPGFIKTFGPEAIRLRYKDYPAELHWLGKLIAKEYKKSKNAK